MTKEQSWNLYYLRYGDASDDGQAIVKATSERAARKALREEGKAYTKLSPKRRIRLVGIDILYPRIQILHDWNEG